MTEQQADLHQRILAWREDGDAHELTPEQVEYNIASGELIQLGAYGHCKYWPANVIHPREYLEQLHAAQDRFENALLALVQPELAALRERLAAAEQHVEELQDKLLSFDDNGKCCCSFDGPGDVCLVHSPTVARLRALLAHDHAAAYHQGEPRDGLLWHCGRDHCTAPSTPPSTAPLPAEPGNAEACPQCRERRDLPYPFLCPGHPTA